MTKQDMERVVDLLIEVGGRTPWILLWDSEDSGVMSSVAPEDVPAMVCAHLLKMLTHEMSPPDVIAREH